MDVLLLMARHAGHVVLREDLLAQLWPNQVVTDDALTRCFYELRRQLSLAGGSERYKAMLETLPKRGYRLNAAVTPLEAPAHAGSPRAPKRRPIAMAIGAAAAIALLIFLGLRFAGPKTPSVAASSYSVAVLPFVDLSAAQDQRYFSDGISEEILDRLANIRQLRVIARKSSFSFRDEKVDIPEIAAKLGVTHVLEGSVRRSGDRLRITAQLIDASSNSHIWSETYDREAGDLLAIQDDIATSVASALSVTLGAAATHGSLPASAEAHDLFLQGQFFYDRRAPGDIQLAARYYQQALDIEPGYARAWAALAGAYSLLAFDGDITPEAGLAKQGVAARKAVELDPNLAEGHARLGQYYWDTGDRKTGFKMLDKARELNPDDLLVLNFDAGIAMRNGDIDGAIENQRRLVALDPRSAAVRANLGTYLQPAGRLDEARSELQKALELNPNFGWGVQLAIARILILQKRFDEAASAIALLPPGEARDHALALLSHAMGRRSEADAALKRLAAESGQSPDIRLAEVYAFRGMKDEAFQALDGLRDAVERNEPAMASQIWTWQLEMRVSPFLKPLHDDPRWTALMVEPG